MESKKIELLTTINQLFTRCGIKSVTMDDIAKENKISKKTLYKFFKDKNDIVQQILSTHCNKDKECIGKILDENKTAIDEILEVVKYVSEKLRQIHPTTHYVIEKYYPKAWKIFVDYKREYVYNCIFSNLKRGIKEGVYRDDLNPEIITKIFISKMDVVFDGEIFPTTDFRFDEVYLEMMRHHLYGISNEKGINYLKSIQC